MRTDIKEVVRVVITNADLFGVGSALSLKHVAQSLYGDLTMGELQMVIKSWTNRNEFSLEQ